MGKQKVCKGIRKRVKVTKNGKVIRKMTGTSHLMSRKNGKQKRQLRGFVSSASGDTKRALRLLALR